MIFLTIAEGAFTRPPADALLERILMITENVAIVLPPFLDIRELENLPLHERQKFYIGKTHERYCPIHNSLRPEVKTTLTFEVAQ